LIARLTRGQGEFYKESGDVQVHHIRKLAELDKSDTPRPTNIAIRVWLPREAAVRLPWLVPQGRVAGGSFTLRLPQIPA
jgi:hypothetical protein